MLEENAIKRFYRQFIFGFNGLDKFDFRYIITVSEAVKRKYVEVGFRERDISVIPPLGIPIELIPNEYKRTSRAKNNLLKLLYVGRIVKEKGVHVAIESVGYMINNLGMNNLNLDIIGEGDLTYMEYLYGLIETLKLKDYVNFRKGMSRDEVLRQYRNYDILVVPSIWEEPFGIIILEAMSQGIPVVATSVGGIPEIIEAEKVGILVPPNDPITMALAIKKLIDNPSLSKKISGNGISLIHNKYTDETIINQIDHYLKNVVLWEQSAKSCKTA
jgi:glycosyltransferase involved in cell wall biosynthesis